MQAVKSRQRERGSALQNAELRALARRQATPACAHWHTQLRAYRFFQQHSGGLLPPLESLSFCYVSGSAVGQAWLGQGGVTESTTHFISCVCVCVCLYLKKKKDRMWTGGCVVDWVSAQLEKQKELKHLSFFLFYFYTSFTLRYCLVVLPPLLFFLTKHHHICRQTPTLVRFFYRAREHPILMLQLQKLHSALTLIAINMWPRAS